MSTRATIQNLIDTNLADNDSNAITPALHREVETAINDSTFNFDVDDSDNITEGAANLFMTSAERSKLAGVEAGADVTDTANVGAAGAFMIATDDTDDINESATKKFLTTNAQTIEGIKTFSSAIDAFRALQNEAGSFTATDDHVNKFVHLTIGAAVTITINDDSETAFPIGGEMEVFWQSDTGSNSVTFAVGGGQSIVSKDSNLALSGVGSAAVIKYLGSNVWALIGDLSA